MSEQPEWTPQEQEMIDYWAGLDLVSSAIGGYMLVASNLPLETITRLLPIAEIAWRNHDPSGALVFHGISSAYPRVEYLADKGVGANVMLGFYQLMADCCVIPLEPIFFLSMRPTKGVQ
jgi:hypothetical protein